MKKLSVILTIIFLIFCSACSLQEKMSPEIFIQRLTENSEFTVKNEFCDDKKFIYYLSDKNNSDYVLEIDTDSYKNSKKICLACVKTNKTDDFISVVEAVIKTYAPNENTKEIISLLFINEWNYYNSQWYKYASSVSEHGLFFSIESIKLSTETDAEMTLKSNDINL